MASQIPFPQRFCVAVTVGVGGVLVGVGVPVDVGVLVLVRVGVRVNVRAVAVGDPPVVAVPVVVLPELAVCTTVGVTSGGREAQLKTCRGWDMSSHCSGN
ncbi:MAG TPA: hypothetical protein ENI95_07620 [Chloroflexi bacterium]|nr:hypothetical protein [Chloroflexota bacterium]